MFSTANAEFTTQYFKLETAVLKFAGISLRDDDSIYYKMYSIIILALTYSYPLLAIGEVFKHDFSVIADFLIYEFSVIVGGIKTVSVFRNRVKFGMLLNKLMEKPFVAKPERGGNLEQKLIEKCVRITTIQSCCYWIGGGLIVSFAFVYTLIKRLRSSDPHDWELAYGPLTLTNISYSPNYEITWLYQNICMITAGCHFCTIDLLIAATLCHVTFQLKLLQNFLRRIVQNCQELTSFKHDVDKSQYETEYLLKLVKEAVQYHLCIIRIAEQMEDVFSNLLLMTYLGTLGMLCFEVYHATTVHVTDFRLIKNVIEALVTSVQVLMVCFWGEEMMSLGTEVSTAAFECDFVGTDLRFQKSLIMIMQRSRRCLKLTAGKYTNVSLAVFTWVMRTSYSAYMVLHKTNGTK